MAPKLAYVYFIDDQQKLLVSVTEDLVSFKPKHKYDFQKNSKFICKWPLKNSIATNELASEDIQFDKYECLILQLVDDESEINNSIRYRIPTSKCLVSADSATESETFDSKGKRKHTDDVVTADIEKIKKNKIENMKKLLFPNDVSMLTNLTNVEASDNLPTRNELTQGDREAYEQKITKLERKLKRRDRMIEENGNLINVLKGQIESMASTQKNKDEIDQVIRLVNGVPFNKKKIEFLMKYDSLTKFIRDLAVLAWNKDELSGSSVSGKKCTNKPDSLPKPPLIGTVKYEAVKELFNEKIVFDKHPKAGVETLKKELNRTLALMISEIAAKGRRQVKKKGSTNISISSEVI